MRPSLRQAINAKCRECIYDPVAAGTWRAQVAECTSSTCPLFEVRPRPELKAVFSAPDAQDQVDGCCPPFTHDPRADDPVSARHGPKKGGASRG